MLVQILSVLVSGCVVCGLVFLFRYEATRGARFGSRFRAHFDFYVLKMRHTFHTRIRGKTRFIFKQILHYFVHTFLTGIIHLLARTERYLKNLVHSNKTFAKRSEHERKTRNKLEEVALHKMEVALTDEEKRRYKRTFLE